MLSGSEQKPLFIPLGRPKAHGHSDRSVTSPSSLSGCEVIEQGLGQDFGRGSQDRGAIELRLGETRSCGRKVDSDQRSLLSGQRQRFLAKVAFLGVQLADGVVQGNALLADIIQCRGNGGGRCRDLRARPSLEGGDQTAE